MDFSMKTNLRIIISLSILFLCGCAQLSGLPQTLQVQELQNKAYAGDLDSQYQLGMQYTINGKWNWDFTRGYKWFTSAAEQGHVDAQYMVGMSKLLGRGTDLDREGAVNFFSSAAEKGHMRAQYQAGNAYLNGAGVEKDASWGRHWLEQAAWNDHQYAQFLLAALFSGGVGGQPNNAEAWKWAKKASQNGLERADKALQNLEEKMSVEELVYGKNLLKREAKFEVTLHKVPRIRYIQTALNQRGYDAGIEDGMEGLRTRSAVAKFVSLNNLPQNIQMSDLNDFLRKYP